MSGPTSSPGNQHVPVTRLLRVVLVFTFFVIALGAYTRLADAGLGCPDWPKCYGHLWLPISGEDQARANAKWSDNPVDIGRAAIEVSHRMAAGVLGLLILVLACLSLTLREERPGIRLLTWAAVALVVIQALFGMWTVTLKLLPQVVVGHLLGGFILLTLLYWCYLRLLYPASSTGLSLSKSCRAGIWLGLALLILQIILGGWLSANYAAIACPDLPTCQGRWLPPLDIAQAFNVMQNVGPNYLGGLMDNTARVTIHFVHRLGGVMLLVYLGLLSLLLLRVGMHRGFRVSVHGMLALLVVQFLLGLANIVLGFPIMIALAHNLVAAMLLLSTVRVLYFS